MQKLKDNSDQSIQDLQRILTEKDNAIADLAKKLEKVFFKHKIRKVYVLKVCFAIY
jgi:hypothetical protein